MRPRARVPQEIGVETVAAVLAGAGLFAPRPASSIPGCRDEIRNATARAKEETVVFNLRRQRVR